MKLYEYQAKEILQKLYIGEGKTIRGVAKMLGCSFETIRLKCKNFGIPLRNPGSERLEIDELTFKRLYIKEGKSRYEIAKIFSCSASTIFQYIKRFGLNNEPQQALFEKIYSEQKQVQSEVVR